MRSVQHPVNAVLICVALVLVCSGHAWGVIVDASSIVAIRHIIPPADPWTTNSDYNAGGIDGQGNIMGMINSERSHGASIEPARVPGFGHAENPVVWKRSDGYEGNVVYGGLPYFTPAIAFHLPLDFQNELDGGVITDNIRQTWANQGTPLLDDAELRITNADSDPHGWVIENPEPECKNSGVPCHRHDYRISVQGDEIQVEDRSGSKPHGLHMGKNRGAAHMVNVNEAGYAVGTFNGDNWDTFSYNIDEDKFHNHSGGMGMFANNNGVVLSSFDDYSESPAPFVAHGDLVSDENERGIIQFLSPDTLRARSINDAGIIVGTATLNEGFSSDAYALRPSGQTEAGYPTYGPIDTSARMEKPNPDGNAIAHAISNSDPPIATGTVIGPPLKGAIWNAEDGTIITTLGSFTSPFGITDDGTIAYGSVKAVCRGCGLLEEAALWYTADGSWTDIQEVYLDDLLLELQDAEVEGADLVEAFSGDVGHCCWVSGINNAGQIVVSGIPALAATLGSPPPSGTAVFLIDTKELQFLAGLPGDVNNDGAINNLDITSFIAALAAEDEAAFLATVPGGSYSNADLDRSGAPNNLDITPFISALTAGASAAAVPEPATLVLLLAAGATALRRRR